jgi:uracil phosphoribosyltransferase
MSNHVTVIDHPLVLHKLSLMRDKETPSAVFRKC